MPDLGDGGTTGPISVGVGSHNVVENEHTTGSLADYVTSVTCVEDPADGTNAASPLTGNGGFEIIQVPVAAGDQWTCTETNTHKGTITVVKDLVPSTDPGLFDLFVDAHEALGVGDGGTHSGRSRSRPATTTWHENEHATGSLANYVTSVTCVENNADGAISAASPLTGNGGFEIITVPVAAGDQWTCTETNTHKGTIEVVKHLIPSSDPGTFDLSVDGTTVPNLGDGGTTGPITVEAGNHNVHENEHATGSLANYVTSVACVENNADGHVSSSSPLTGNGGFEIITVLVAAGDQWLCTETNTRATATLTVVKHVVNDNGGGATADQWTMAVTGGSPSPATFAGSETGTTVNHPRQRRVRRGGVGRPRRVHGGLVRLLCQRERPRPRRHGDLHDHQRRPARDPDADQARGQ